MDGPIVEEGGGNTPFRFGLIPMFDPEMLLRRVRSSVARGLPEIKECAAHDGILAIAGGGPSLEDTYKDLTGYVAAVNGSLAYLLSKGIVPHMCGVCDPTEHMADVVEAHPDVTYFIASHCHPKLFDKLKDCKVYLWHLTMIDGIDELLKELYPDGTTQIRGGCTMGLKWFNLGYHMGFRKIHLSVASPVMPTPITRIPRNGLALTDIRHESHSLDKSQTSSSC